MTSGLGSLAMLGRAAVSETSNSASSKCSDSCMFALLTALGSALLSDDIQGFTGGSQGDRYKGGALLETDQRHIDLLGRNLDSPTDSAGALSGHQRGAAAAKGFEDDFAFLRVGLDDLRR